MCHGSLGVSRTRFLHEADEPSAENRRLAVLMVVGLELEAPRGTARHEADRGGQAALSRTLVSDALRIVVTRIVEHGARRGQLRKDELGRRQAAGLCDVD